MEKIQANMIIEILGRPKENVSNAIKNLIEKLGTEKGVSLIEKTLHEPVSVPDSKNLFTTFAEVTVEFDSLGTYMGIMFAYLPSNIQIISPEKVLIKNDDLTVLGNKIIQRIHDYDAITKKTLAERETLIRKLHEVAPHLFKKHDKKAESNADEEKQLKTKNRKSSKKEKS